MNVFELLLNIQSAAQKAHNRVLTDIAWHYLPVEVSACHTTAEPNELAVTMTVTQTPLTFRVYEDHTGIIVEAPTDCDLPYRPVMAALHQLGDALDKAVKTLDLITLLRELYDGKDDLIHYPSTPVSLPPVVLEPLTLFDAILMLVDDGRESCIAKANDLLHTKLDATVSVYDTGATQEGTFALTWYKPGKLRVVTFSNPEGVITTTTKGAPPPNFSHEHHCKGYCIELALAITEDEASVVKTLIAA